jgi:outer membrane protein OmpA-like peptidoglycan-associated protein
MAERGTKVICGAPIPSSRVIRVLEQLLQMFGKPEAIRLDNGPKLTAEAYVDWPRRTVKLVRGRKRGCSNNPLPNTSAFRNGTPREGQAMLSNDWRLRCLFVVFATLLCVLAMSPAAGQVLPADTRVLQDRFRVFYPRGQTEVPKAFNELLASAADLARRMDFLVVTVHGHSDKTGSAQKNWELAEARAQIVADALISQGVDRAVVSVDSFGADRPFIAAPSGSELNRRVEISIYGIPKIAK